VRLAILADDLTAATHCALPAVRLSARTRVLLVGTERESLDDWDAVAWDLDTRRLAEAGVATRVARAASRVRAGDALYLNVQSAPRRNVGSVIDAALAGSGRRLAVFAPALPALGRITTHGRQHAPTWPVGGIDLLAWLRATSCARVAPLHDAALQNGGPTRARGKPGSLIVVCDATTEEDLARLVASCARLDEPAVWVGSTALAAPLTAAVLGSPVAPPAMPPRRTGPVLVVLGSMPRPIEARLSTLRSVLRLAPVEVDPLALACGGARAERMIDEAAAAVARALSFGADTALFARRSEPALNGLWGRTAEGFAAVAGRALGRVRAGGLVLTGGQTARAVCDALAIAGIELVGEIERGVALGRAVGSSGKGQEIAGLHVVASAGTFGHRLSLVRALAAFERGAA
jgi:D-threonate/D-erythronate kinase